MRARILGAVLAALFAPLALAADPVSRSKIIGQPTLSLAAAEAQETAWNRSGFYVGGLAGYDVTILQAEGIDLANGKLMGGAFLGWNYRAGGMVLGIEADWMFTGISAATTSEEVLLKASTDHLVTIRARTGIPLGPALLYATAGPAWQNAKLTANELSERTWQLGGVFGGGAEVELSRSLFVRLEALHYIFPNDGAPLQQFLDSENQHTTVRLGLGFKLN